MTVTLTETAAERVRHHLQKKGEGRGLRVAVKQSGCSGYAYVLDYAKDIEADDAVFESYGVKVIVKQAHMNFLQGLEVDYKEAGLSSAFHFHNPNVTDQCGCGESFTVN